MRLSKKRVFLIFIISLLVLGGVKTRYINKFREGFYFEKYSTTEEAKAGLLELHPIGSDVGELMRTLDLVSRQDKTFDIEEDKVTDRISSKGNYVYFSYNKPELIFYTEWRVIIYFKGEVIEKLDVLKFYQYL